MSSIPILVVDDDRISNMVVARRLELAGYEVTTAATGEEAINLLSIGPVDVVCLDVSMPGMSGLEVLEWIRERNLDVAVIMMTAYGTEDIAVEALRQGADDYLRKPVDSAELRMVLTRSIHRLELGRQNAALRRDIDNHRLRLEAEMARAGIVQAELLPDSVPQIRGFDIAARCIPAQDVGGDYYSWFEPEPGVVSFTLGDVMGKGMPAALMMATVRAAIRAVAQQNSPATVLNVTARTLGRDLERASSFVTLFHAQLKVATRQLAYVDVGHGHLFLRRADGTTETLGERGLPLGVWPEEMYEEAVLTFRPGDSLIIYSDGLIDSRPELDLGVEKLAAVLEGATSASAMVARLVEVADTAEPLPDDLTILVLLCLNEQQDSSVVSCVGRPQTTVTRLLDNE